MMRSLAVLLAVNLLAASPPLAAAAADRVAELTGTWTCRDPAGVISTVEYRAENGDIIADERTPGGPVAHDRFSHDPTGGWHVERATAYSRYIGFGPAWTARAWIIDDSQKHGTQIRYERIGDGTLWRTFSMSGRAPYAGEVCAKGTTPPDPGLCAVPDVPPSVVKAMEPDPPIAAVQSRISGRVEVLVSLDTAGHVVNAMIKESASAVLNNASLTAARRSTYRPALHDCKPVPSEYIFSVDFSSR
jgi:hypothetical protein